MDIIAACGGYFAVHVGNDENTCARWHGFNFRPWHIGIFAMTRHGVTLVGVVSAGSSETFTWWANCHGKFYAEIYSVNSYSGPDDCDVLKYRGSYGDFLDCVDAAAAFLDEDEDY